MLFTDFWLLEEFCAQHPPSDLLVASYLGYKTPGKQVAHRARKDNAEAIKAIPMRVQQMPAFLKTPEMMQLIEQMKNEPVN
jgi:hypothetical protein